MWDGLDGLVNHMKLDFKIWGLGYATVWLSKPVHLPNPITISKQGLEPKFMEKPALSIMNNYKIDEFYIGS